MILRETRSASREVKQKNNCCECDTKEVGERESKCKGDSVTTTTKTTIASTRMCVCVCVCKAFALSITYLRILITFNEILSILVIRKGTQRENQMKWDTRQWCEQRQNCITAVVVFVAAVAVIVAVAIADVAVFIIVVVTLSHVPYTYISAMRFNWFGTRCQRKKK